IRKIKVETRIKEIQEQKMLGEMIPVDLVKSIINQLSQGFVYEFKNYTDNHITILAKRKSFNGNEVAEIRGEIQTTINIAVNKAIEYSRKNIEAIQKEFSVKREIGQHD